MQYFDLDHKEAGYYQQDKKRIVNLIPEGPHTVLDLGCASGKLGWQLQRLNRAIELIGVELFEPAGKEAAKIYDTIHIGDIEQLDLPYEAYFDFIICGDILEHLRDPWSLIKRIHHWLKPQGTFITSIPNIRYWRVLRDLILFGKWEYVEAGILDNTHLRFFTRRSFQESLERANFRVVQQNACIGGKKQELFNTVTGGLFEEFLGAQYMIAAQKGTETAIPLRTERFEARTARAWEGLGAAAARQLTARDSLS